MTGDGSRSPQNAGDAADGGGAQDGHPGAMTPPAVTPPGAARRAPHGRKGLSRSEGLSAIAAGVCIGLAGVGAWWAFQPAVDNRAASICRAVIPALNPPGTAFTIGAAVAGAFDRSLRISYVAHFADGRLRRRDVACRFATDDAGAPERLTAVATERGPLSETNFYFLRRFYLEADDGPPPDPAAAQATAPRH